MANENLQATYALYSHLPLRGKRLYDKALIGRLAVGKPRDKYEKQIGEIIPKPSKKETYLAERAVTHPIGAALVSGGFSAGLKAAKPHYMEELRKRYVNLENMKLKSTNSALAPVGKALEQIREKGLKIMRVPLLEPKELRVIREPWRIKQLYGTTPKSIAAQGVKWGLIGAGGAMLARHLHAKALLGEIMKEHTQTKQRDPSEYIRTKLRGDVQLKYKAESLAKQAENKNRVRGAIVGAAAGLGAGSVQAHRYLKSVEGGKEIFHTTIQAAEKMRDSGVSYTDVRRAAKAVVGTKKAIPYIAGGLAAGTLIGHGVKKYQEKHAMDQTAQKLALGVAEIMKQAAMGEMVEGALAGAKSLLAKTKPLAAKAGEGLAAVGHGMGDLAHAYPKSTAALVGTAGIADIAGQMHRGMKKEKTAAVLSTERREEMPKKEFAIPAKKTESNPEGSGAYPIPDKAHARNALARVSQHGSSAEKAKVRAKVHAKYPDIGEEKKAEVSINLLEITASLLEKFAKNAEEKKAKEEEKAEKKEEKKESPMEEKKEGKKGEEKEEKKAAKLSKEEFIERFVKAKKGDKKEEKKETKK